MKKMFLLVASLLMLILVPVEAKDDLPELTDHEKVVINMFRGNGCGACHNALTELLKLDGKYDDYVEIKTYEVWKDDGNQALLNAVMTEFEVPKDNQAIPFFVIGNKYYVGYNEDEIFGKALELYEDKKYSDYISKKIKDGKFKPTVMTLEEAATQDGIIGNSAEDKKEETTKTEGGKYDTIIIIGIFTVVIAGFAALIITSNKKN